MLLRQEWAQKDCQKKTMKILKDKNRLIDFVISNALLQNTK